MTFLRHPHWLKAWLGPFLPATWRHRLVQQLQRYNWKKPSPLAPALRAAVTRSFQDEIAQLQHLLARDLSHWLAPTINLQ